MIMCRFYNYTQTVGAHRGADCIAQQGACFVLITSVAVGLNSTRGPLCTGAAVRSHLPPTVSHFSHPVSSSPHCVPSSVPLLSSSRSPPHCSRFIFMSSNSPNASASPTSPVRQGPRHTRAYKPRAVRDAVLGHIRSPRWWKRSSEAARRQSSNASLNCSSRNYVLRPDQSNKAIFVEQLFSVMHLKV